MWKNIETLNLSQQKEFIVIKSKSTSEMHNVFTEENKISISSNDDQRMKSMIW